MNGSIPIPFCRSDAPLVGRTTLCRGAVPDASVVPRRGGAVCRGRVQPTLRLGRSRPQRVREALQSMRKTSSCFYLLRIFDIILRCLFLFCAITLESFVAVFALRLESRSSSSQADSQALYALACRGTQVAAAGASRTLHVFDTRKWSVRGHWSNCLKYEAHHYFPTFLFLI